VKSVIFECHKGTYLRSELSFNYYIYMFVRFKPAILSEWKNGLIFCFRYEDVIIYYVYLLVLCLDVRKAFSLWSFLKGCGGQFVYCNWISVLKVSYFLLCCSRLKQFHTDAASPLWLLQSKYCEYLDHWTLWDWGLSFGERTYDVLCRTLAICAMVKTDDVIILSNFLYDQSSVVR